MPSKLSFDPGVWKSRKSIKCLILRIMYLKLSRQDNMSSKKPPLSVPHKTRTSLAEEDWKKSSVFEEYEFIDLLGKGAFATVWKARDKRTGERVAIKVSHIDKGSISAIVKEFIALKKFDHPNIVKSECFYHNARKNSAFMVLRLYDMDLFSFVDDRDNPLGKKTLRKLILDIGGALKQVHDADLVHRDVKPENILVGDDGTFVLTDFGGAEHVDYVTIDKIIGTGAYLAPEVAAGYSRMNEGVFTIGKPSDIYSFGMTLYLAATQTHGCPNYKDIRSMVRYIPNHDMIPMVDSMNHCEELKDLLRGMLDRHAIQRLTIDEVLTHPFLKNKS